MAWQIFNIVYADPMNLCRDSSIFFTDPALNQAIAPLWKILRFVAELDCPGIPGPVPHP
jgi:hypothetical protein